MMVVNMGSRGRGAVWSCLWILLSFPVLAQERHPSEPGKANGNGLRRIFYGNHTSPPVRGYQLGRDSWESLRDLQNSHSILLQARIDLIKRRIAADKALGNTFAAHNIELRDALRSFK